MIRLEIASAVEQIVAAVVYEHGLMEARDAVTVGSRLDDDLGMDEVDLIEVLFRAEERFGLVLPDNDIGPSSTVNDIVDLIAKLKQKEASLARAQDSGSCALATKLGLPSAVSFTLETDGWGSQARDDGLDRAGVVRPTGRR